MESSATGVRSLVVELAKDALERLSKHPSLVDNDLALMYLTEYFQKLSTNAASHKTMHYTVRFKIECDERLIQDVLDTRVPHLFLSAQTPLDRIVAARVKEGLLWIHTNDRESCRSIRQNSRGVNDLFKNAIRPSQANVLRLIPETYLLCLTGFYPSSGKEKRSLPQIVLKAAVTANGLTGTIKKVTYNSQLWIMYLDTEQDAVLLARRGEMALDNRLHVKVK